MDSYLTPDELAAVQHLYRGPPYVIDGISHGIFSIARGAGGMTYQGDSYVYMPATDECVRIDVVKCVEKMRRAAAKKARTPAGQPTQSALGI